MGESLFPIATTFNRSLRIEARPERLTGEAGAVILREIIERTGIGAWLARRLVDRRNPLYIHYPLRDLVPTMVVLLGQGWRDQDDADALRDDAALRLAASSLRGVAPRWPRTGVWPRSRRYRA